MQIIIFDVQFSFIILFNSGFTLDIFIVVKKIISIADIRLYSSFITILYHINEIVLEQLYFISNSNSVFTGELVLGCKPMDAWSFR